MCISIPHIIGRQGKEVFPLIVETFSPSLCVCAAAAVDNADAAAGVRPCIHKRIPCDTESTFFCVPVCTFLRLLP